MCAVVYLNAFTREWLKFKAAKPIALKFSIYHDT